ncbi:MAG: glycosyltransferase family 2 protein [Leptospiraceae bacterium]|nr:glycosyltransferase family 2 protein [Leptospiraceae bacterium]
MSLALSACIITLNEEKNIERCILSLNLANEIILLDSGSIDKTIEIAKKFSKVKIFHRNFDNYIDQKNHCISLAQNDWVLVLDADESLSPELEKEIFQNFDNTNYNGFYFPRLTHYLGKWIYHGGWYPNYQLKLFRKSKGKFAGMLVHEKVELEGNIFKLKNPIYHFSYENIEDHIRYINKYSTLHAEERFQRGKKSSILYSLGKGFYKFFYMYMIKLGFLDGRAGLIIATLGAFYNFLKYAKLAEKQLKKNNTI